MKTTTDLDNNGFVTAQTVYQTSAILSKANLSYDLREALLSGHDAS